jgi:hypothetical protein
MCVGEGSAPPPVTSVDRLWRSWHSCAEASRNDLPRLRRLPILPDCPGKTMRPSENSRADWRMVEVIAWTVEN